MREDPLLAFRFAVEIQGIVVGWFTTCSELTLERGVTPHPEGGQNAYVYQLPGPMEKISLTLERGIADRKLWRWFRQGLYDLKVEPRKVSVVLYRTDHTEFERWDIPGAVPVKWTGPDFKNDDNLVAVETLELALGEGVSELVQRANEEEAGQEASVSAESARASRGEIDVQALANQVYDLLKEDIMFEQERQGWLASRP